MKKFIVLTITGLMILSPFSVFADDDLEARVTVLEERVAALEAQLTGSEPAEATDATIQPNQEETTAESASADTYFEYDGYSLQYIGHDIAQDYNGNNVLVVYFDYVNNSGEDKAANWAFNIKAFQNGKENTGIPFLYPDIPEHTDSTAQIMSGSGPIRIAFLEPLVDMSDVILRIKPFISFGDEYLDIPITLQ